MTNCNIAGFFTRKNINWQLQQSCSNLKNIPSRKKNFQLSLQIKACFKLALNAIRETIKVQNKDFSSIPDFGVFAFNHWLDNVVLCCC